MGPYMFGVVGDVSCGCAGRISVGAATGRPLPRFGEVGDNGMAIGSLACVGPCAGWGRLGAAAVVTTGMSVGPTCGHCCVGEMPHVSYAALCVFTTWPCVGCRHTKAGLQRLY